MISGRLRAGVVIALIVVASAVVGAAIERTLIQQPRRRPPGNGPGRPSGEQDARRRNEMLDRMTKNLGLTPAQRTGIDSVMQHTDSSFRAIRAEMQPRLEKVFERSRAEIRARLTPDQQVKYDSTMRRGRGRGRP